MSDAALKLCVRRFGNSSRAPDLQDLNPAPAEDLPAVNWFLMFAAFSLVLALQSSSNLANSRYERIRCNSSSHRQHRKLALMSFNDSVIVTGD